MEREIKCSVPGCTEPVVGQCTGYKSTCLRFYCAQHSSGTLCSECASQKAYDEEVQRIYEDYLNTAESIPRADCGTRFVIAILSVVLAVVLIVILQIDSGLLVCVGFIASSPGLIAILWLEARADRKVKKISEKKPGFEEFYRLWRKQKSEEELLTVAAIGIAALGAAAGAYEAYQRPQLYRDVHKIKKKLLRPDRMISREEVEKAIFHGEVIEDYPEDPRGHSCLICYYEPPNRPIHVVCSPKVEYLVVITTYIPDSAEWSPDFKRRL